MMKGKDVELGVSEQKRRARHLQLILHCAGPGSVTGSRSNQCCREGRPHGGYKGLSNQYPLSRPGFDKREFMEEVRNAVNAQYRKEQRCRTNSPQWLPAANRERSHTGEQPLILQNFLAGNKQEQTSGVLPAPSNLSAGNRLTKSASMYMYRDDPDYYCRGNSTHQYLTATEMPGQSERLVNLALGRPTRTSLLRVRQRTKSAPGVKAVVEIKTHLHKQQYLAAKTEDRYKSVDFPQDLLPMTDNETVHQFLIGARYNRLYHRDAKCLSKLGLFVSRQDPQHCFKMKAPTEGGQSGVSQRSVSSTKGTESYVPNKSEVKAFRAELQNPKAAWSTKKEMNLASKEGIQSCTPGASSPLADCSQDMSTSKSAPGPCSKNRPKKNLIDGRTLNDRIKEDNLNHSCVICKSEESSRWYHGFAPRNRYSRIRDDRAATKEEQGLVWDHGADQIVLQQYHLRIRGVKYGTTLPDRHSAPHCRPDPVNRTDPSVFNKPNNLKIASQIKNTTAIEVQTAETKALNFVQAPALANTSKISVKMSNHSGSTDKVAPPSHTDVSEAKRALPQPSHLGNEASETERAELLKDANNNLSANGDTAELELLEKKQDEVRKNEAPEDGGNSRDNEMPEDIKLINNGPTENSNPRDDEALEDGSPRDKRLGDSN